MAWRIIVQPNGKYARFSEAVDNFTDYNLSRKQAFTLCKVSLGTIDSEEKIINAEKSPHRFEEALGIIRRIYGKKTEKEIRTELTKPGGN